MNEESEMVDVFFSYEKKICRGLIATYTNCFAKQSFGHIRSGNPIDEVVIDYSIGKMQFFHERQLLDTFTIDLFINDGTEPVYIPEHDENEGGKYTEEMMDQPKQYMDAQVALAMIEQNLSVMPQSNFGAPNLSDTFGKYIEENREKDGLPPKDD